MQNLCLPFLCAPLFVFPFAVFVCLSVFVFCLFVCFVRGLHDGSFSVSPDACLLSSSFRRIAWRRRKLTGGGWLMSIPFDLLRVRMLFNGFLMPLLAVPPFFRDSVLCRFNGRTHTASLCCRARPWQIWKTTMTFAGALKLRPSLLRFKLALEHAPLPSTLPISLLVASLDTEALHLVLHQSLIHDRPCCAWVFFDP